MAKIKAGWTEHKPGWIERYNQLTDYINDYADPSEIKPALTPEELDWYEKSLAELKKQNAEIEKLCKENDMEPWKAKYGHMSAND